MKVSVIIAAYNIQNYIERCLISVINQTLKDIEIIVVNDGSKDSTLEKVKNIAQDDQRIIIVNQDNKGLIEARKSGLKIAKGEYVLFVDGDDWLEIDALNELYYSAIKCNSDIVLYNAFFSYDSKRQEKNTFIDSNDIIQDPLKELFKNNIWPSIWSKLIKRSYIIDNNIEFPENISFAEDLATVSVLFINRPKISTINKCLYNYYQRSSSITQSIDKRVLDVDIAIEFIKDQLIKNKIYDEYKVYFEYLVYVHLYETKFLVYDKFDDIHKSLYRQYMNRSINLKNNKYIIDRMNNYSIGYKIRSKAYLRGYSIGKTYDKVRKMIKK